MGTSLEPEEESLDGRVQDESEGDAAWSERPTVRSYLLVNSHQTRSLTGCSQRRGRPTRKKRRKTDDGKASRAESGSSFKPAVSLQPLLDFLTSKHASEDSEDTSFDTVAGSVLAEYAERRDELEERHERDDLVSFYFPSSPLSSTTRQFSGWSR